jgi:hypothetical protein
MDNAERKRNGKKEWQSSVKPSTVIFFINNDLVRLIHSNRASNICTIYNYIQDKEQTMILSDFKKHRRKAYTFMSITKIFGRSRVQFERMIKAEIILPPTGAVPGGKRVWQKMSYYSEDDLFAIREAMSHIHSGRPRKDGRITPRKNIPTEKELRSLIGDAIMLYTQNKNGEFIPVWAEETW